MVGYVRADTGNNIDNGNIIDATYLDQEFDAIVAAFHASTGHVHDGTAANGSPITKIGPAQDFIASATDLKPKTTNVYDLGTTSLKYKDGYFAGSLLPALFVANASGTAGAPEYTWTGDTHTGMYRSADNEISFTAGGTQKFFINATNARSIVDFNCTTTITGEEFKASSNGAAGDPSYNWSNDNTSGMYLIAVNNIGISCNSTKIVDISTTGISITGTLVTSGTITGTLSGNASTATALATSRTIGITGQITGTATSFDGTSNISIPVDTLSASNLNAGTVPNARLSGTYSGVTGTGTLSAGAITTGFGNITIGGTINCTDIISNDATIGGIKFDGIATNPPTEGGSQPLIGRSTTGGPRSTGSLILTSDPDSSTQISFWTSNAGVLAEAAACLSNGDFTIEGDYLQSSDISLKTNIYDISNALNTISKLKGVSYTRKSTGRKELGLIAQEVEPFVPEVVTTNEKSLKSISYTKLVPLLINAINELSKKVDSYVR